MAYDFGKAFLSLFQPQQSDVRTPQTKQMEQNQLNNTSQLQNEYAQASANPNSGLGTPDQQLYMEQNLANSVRNRTASGSGESTAQGDEVRKAIMDYRIGQIGQRQAYLNNLRGAMVQSSNGAQQPMQNSTSLGQKLTSDIAGRAGSKLGDSLFGRDPEKMAQANQQAAQLGAQPGGTGFRVNGPGQQGGQGGGNGVQSPWGLSSGG